MWESLNHSPRVHGANQVNTGSKHTSRKSVLWGTDASKGSSGLAGQTDVMRTSSKVTAAGACRIFVVHLGLASI